MKSRLTLDKCLAMASYENVWPFHVIKHNGFEQTFEGSYLQILNATFEIFILYYIMEYVGNFPLHEQSKR